MFFELILGIHDFLVKGTLLSYNFKKFLSKGVFSHQHSVRTKVYIRMKGKKALGVGETSGKAVESTIGEHPVLISGKHSKRRQAADKAGSHEEAEFRPSNEGSTEVPSAEVAVQEKGVGYGRYDVIDSEKEKEGREKIAQD